MLIKHSVTMLLSPQGAPYALDPTLLQVPWKSKDFISEANSMTPASKSIYPKIYQMPFQAMNISCLKCSEMIMQMQKQCSPKNIL